jgi:hypothetical protein
MFSKQHVAIAHETVHTAQASICLQLTVFAHLGTADAVPHCNLQCWLYNYSYCKLQCATQPLLSLLSLLQNSRASDSMHYATPEQHAAYTQLH